MLAGWFSRRGRLADAAWIGAALMASGVAAMNADSYALVLAGFLFNGLGIGLTLPSINLLILEIYPDRSAAALSILNFCWGVGAIVCKPFVDLTAGETTITVTTAVVSALLLVSGVVIYFLLSPVPKVEREAPADVALTPRTPIWTTPVALAIAAFNFIHVGFESGMSGWLTTYAVRLSGADHAGIISPTFLYFLCFVIGRAVAPVFFRFLNENKMLLVSLVVILVGMLIAITATNVSTLSTGAALAGLGTSSVFPTNVSRFYRIFGAEAMHRATPLFLCGTLGGAAATYSIGWISNRYDDLRFGMYVLLFNIIVLIAIQTVLIRSKSDI
jgi:fucose permease